MCGGRAEMAAKTSRQLEGTKKKATATPQAKTVKTKAKDNRGGTRGAAGTKAGRSSGQTENADIENLDRDGGVNGSEGSGTPVKPLTEAGKKRLVNRLLGLADAQATQGSFKITPADLIRLMQLHREMNPQKDRKVTVQWIEDKPE